MESIVSKVHVEFQHALFTILDKKIRIKDLEQSKKLRDEIVQLSKDVKPTKLAWLYLDQLKKQDRCFAEPDCMLKHRATVYKSPLCEEHFVSKNHQLNPCLAKHEHVLGREYQAKDDT
jgi:hypothetical protein